jgi:hypothetical protein
LIGVVEDPSGGCDDIMNFTKNGRFWDDNNDSSLDLFIVEEVKTFYTNVYKLKDGRIHFSGIAYETREKALDCIDGDAHSKYIKTIEVTDEADETVEENDNDVKQFDDFENMLNWMLKYTK